MKKFHKFLFYYGIIFGTILFLTVLFFVPRMENIILAILFLPLILYFWVTLSRPNEVSFGHWSGRLLFIVFLFSSLGIFAHSLALQASQEKEIMEKNLDASQTAEELKAEVEKLRLAGESDQDILERLDKIKEELAGISSQQTTKQTLGTTTETEPAEDSSDYDQIRLSTDSQVGGPLGFIIIKDRDQLTNIYQQPSSSSKVIGQFEYNQEYPFFKNEDCWFQITLPDGVEGWIESQFGQNLKEAE